MTLQCQPSSARVLAGVARRDITPPVGIYARMWGAAEHDQAEGVHRPLTATVLALLRSPTDAPLLLVSLDWCVLAEAAALREPLVRLAGGQDANVIVACTHTHGIGYISPARADLPGGHLIPPYLDATHAALHDAAREAIAQAQYTPAIVTAATGRCTLATNRDLPEPGGERYVCGYNPAGEADDTLLVLRVTDANDRILATVVNYACHPTTLAWENRLISPDYVGALREVVEAHTDSAPCLFVQGASGELAPAHQYVGDPAVADAHGRCVGFAALSALHSMLPPGQELVYHGVVESGAPLASWRTQPFAPSAVLTAERFDAALPMKPLPTAEALHEQMRRASDRALTERLRRQLQLVEKMASASPSHVWLWRLGDILLVAQPNEPYSAYQCELRRRLPNHAVLVLSVANGTWGYLYPEALADSNLYQVWQSPFAQEALQTLTDRTVAHALTMAQGR